MGERDIYENANIHRLSLGDREVTLIGTAHVSRESADVVEEVIEREHPDTVCIELCQARFQSITEKKRWQDTDLLKVIREKKAFLLLSNLMLAYFQKKIGQRLGVRPGEEMLRAIQAAESAGASIHLADRDIRTTLARAWRMMGLWTRIKLLTQFVVSLGDMDDISEEEIERMKQKDVLESLLSEMGQSFPDIRRILIDERDLYLAERIRTAPGRRIVAVVGAGHVPGIQRNWEQPVDLRSLEELPPKSRMWGIVKWGIPVLIVGLVILGFFTAGNIAGAHMIKWWVLANAALAGLGAAAALGHPLTVLSAVLASPLTSLNPMVAAGWVSGLVETFVGRPKVRDFERLSEDISSLKGFWKNKITRILLVVVLTNLGSSLGTFVAIPLMVRAMG
ncbi:MAG: TraB/GumN family protein [Deltaproteobacteria bacterium]|nr:TraB/GumN family protein [Deltaproteobacteria bacterium]